MDRREFLTARRKRQNSDNESGSGQPFRTLSGINPYTGSWTDTEVIHLLKRTMFGSKKLTLIISKQKPFLKQWMNC
jgi:hypothetical protein